MRQLNIQEAQQIGGAKFTPLESTLGGTVGGAVLGTWYILATTPFPGDYGFLAAPIVALQGLVCGAAIGFAVAGIYVAADYYFNGE